MCCILFQHNSGSFFYLFYIIFDLFYDVQVKIFLKRNNRMYHPYTFSIRMYINHTDRTLFIDLCFFNCKIHFIQDSDIYTTR